MLDLAVLQNQASLLHGAYGNQQMLMSQPIDNTCNPVLTTAQKAHFNTNQHTAAGANERLAQTEQFKPGLLSSQIKSAAVSPKSNIKQP